jgi:hypothetical protein
MVNRITAIILLVSLTTANFSRFFIYAGFELNKNYIASKLCENRDKPWLHCNGHCYFMKKIKQAQENEKKQQAKDNLNRLEISFFQESYRIPFIEPVVLENNKSTFPRYTYQYSSSYLSTIFRPPKQAV